MKNLNFLSLVEQFRDCIDKQNIFSQLHHCPINQMIVNSF